MEEAANKHKPQQSFQESMRKAVMPNCLITPNDPNQWECNIYRWMQKKKHEFDEESRKKIPLIIKSMKDFPHPPSCPPSRPPSRPPPFVKNTRQWVVVRQTNDEGDEDGSSEKIFFESLYYTEDEANKAMGKFEELENNCLVYFIFSVGHIPTTKLNTLYAVAHFDRDEVCFYISKEDADKMCKSKPSSFRAVIADDCTENVWGVLHNWKMC